MFTTDPTLAASSSSSSSSSSYSSNSSDIHRLIVAASHHSSHSAISPAVLPLPFARLVSTVSTLTRLSLKTANCISHLMLTGIKKGAKSWLNLSKLATLKTIDAIDLLNGLSRSTNLLTHSTLSNTYPHRLLRNPTHQHQNNFYLIICALAVQRGFLTAESLVDSVFDNLDHVTSTSLKTIDELVHLFDGIFGFTETSHAVSIFLTLVREELLLEAEDYPALTEVGLANIFKTIFAYSIIQAQNRDKWLDSIQHRVLLSVSVNQDIATSSTSGVKEQLSLMLGNEDELVSCADSTEFSASTRISWDINYSSLSPASSNSSLGNGPHLKPFHESYAHILENLTFLSKVSSGIYGRRFLKTLNIAHYKRPSLPIVDTLGRHHPETHFIFSQHSTIPLECIVGSSFKDQQLLFPVNLPKITTPEYLVAVDHERKFVIATLRGTFALSDLITSLTCKSANLTINSADYDLHIGMLAQAKTLAHPSHHFYSIVKQALEENEGYTLVLNGHSLGGGVAAIIGILWSNLSISDSSDKSCAFWISEKSGLPSFRPIHVYIIGAPCIGSPELSAALKGLVTSVVNNHDFISRLSLGGIRDLKQIIHLLSSEKSELDENLCDKIISSSLSKIVPITHPKQQKSSVSISHPELSIKFSDILDDKISSSDIRESFSADLEDEKSDTNWYRSIHSALLASSDAKKHYPPGDVYFIHHEERSVSNLSGAEQKSSIFDIKHPSITSQVPPRPQFNDNFLQSNSNQENTILKLVHVENVEKMFGEMQFTKNMIMDHSPGNYEWALEALFKSAFSS